MRLTDHVTDRVAFSNLPDPTIHAGQDAKTRKYDEDKLEAPSAPNSSRASRGGRGLGASRLVELGDQLSNRDIAILEQLREHRYLTTQQLTRFCFTDHASAASAARTTRRVLARLGRDRLIERPFRRVGGLGAGSATSVWMLTSSGVRLRNQRDGLGAIGRAYPPGQGMVRHFLAVANTHLALLQAQNDRRIVVHQVEVEPSSWRTYQAVTRTVLKPDLFAVTSPNIDPTVEDHWFCEIDRGTEAIPRLIDQCRRYEAYRASGDLDAGDVFPLVVWIIPNEHRAQRLREAIHRSRLTEALYRIATPDQFVLLIEGGAV